MYLYGYLVVNWELYYMDVKLIWENNSCRNKLKIKGKKYNLNEISEDLLRF